jgi:hypothetical protein
MELTRFALNLVPDEESRIERFQESLHPRIRDKVVCLEIKDFTKLVMLLPSQKEDIGIKKLP